MLRIRQLLEERHISLSQLSHAANVNATSLSRITRGLEPPFPKRGQRIADALGWEGDWQDLFAAVSDNG